MHCYRVLLSLALGKSVLVKLFPVPDKNFDIELGRNYENSQR